MDHQHYRVVISYNGSNYFGWQDLGGQENKATVQGTLTKALSRICKYTDCTVAGASRTDAGVHAQGQVAKLSILVKISTAKLQLGLNSLLPDDIRILHCDACSKDFNPNKHCISKRYRYYFSTDRVSSPQLNDIVAHVPIKLEGTQNAVQLDLELMKQACVNFLGQHDFYSFATRDKNNNLTVRTISQLQLQKTQALGMNVDVYFFEIEGDGFLRHMIRYMLGAIIEVGRGGINSDDIRQALRERSEEKLSPKAKARGLHLVEISYK